MRLVRLKPQGPGPDRGPDCPVQQKIYKVGPLWAPKFLEKICGLLKFLPQRGPQSLSCLRARRDHDPALLTCDYSLRDSRVFSRVDCIFCFLFITWRSAAT